MVNHVAMSQMTKSCDEREEGEIIEDDLEDVSDSSMFPSSPVDSGKSVSPELLSAVCLSSVSSTDYCRPFGRNYYENSLRYKKWRQRRKRKECNVKRRNSYVRRHKRISVEVQSESDNELVDPKYAKQLKEALKHETPQELHNSLRTRLKAFIDPASLHSDEDGITALRGMALLSTLESASTSNQNDEPITAKGNKNLIVENFEDSELYELRMAALKSVVLEKHEQRKRKRGDCANAVCPVNVDKENDQSIINNDIKNQDSVVEEVINKKVVVEEPLPEKNDNNSIMEDDVDILRAMLLASMTKTLSTKFPGSNNAVSSYINKQEMFKSEHKSTLAKHAIVNPLIININDDSDSDMEPFGEENISFKETVTEFLKKQRAEVEENVKKNENINKSDDFIMDKSVMCLLPRSQQLEYRQLKQKLLNARKKTRLRRTSQRLSDSATLVKKLPKVKTIDASSSTNAATASVNGKLKTTVQERKNIQPNLQKTLSELQIRKNGRLQMKGKYRSLGVLLHKINAASNVRRQHELEIKKLLHEIQKARVKLAMSHQNFTNLVQQLVKEKQVIDQSVFKSSVPFTSTPKRNVNKQFKKVDNIKESSSTITPNEVNIVKEEEEKVYLEPNDVSKVFVQQTEILKYTSPLDNRDRNEINDPLSTLCPYDVIGTCKDKECKYVHCW